MKRGVLLFLSIVLLSCSIDGIKEIHYSKKAELVLEKRLECAYSDSFYIGKVTDIEVIKNKIYVSDRVQCKVFVFDENLNCIASSGGKGRGPGEFVRVPSLTKINDSLVTPTLPQGLICYLNDKFEVIKAVRAEKRRFGDTFGDFVQIGSKIIYAANNKPHGMQPTLNGITTAVVKDGKNEKEICLLDKRYLDNQETENFRGSGVGSYVIKGFGNTFFVIQRKILKLFQYDENGNLVNTLKYKPVHFTSAPLYSLKEFYGLSKVKKDEYYQKETFISRGCYDEAKKLVIVNYWRYGKNGFSTLSNSGVKSFIYVINENYECILDVPIEGKFKAFDNGYLYTIVGDQEKLQINKYSIRLLNENKQK